MKHTDPTPPRRGFARLEGARSLDAVPAVPESDPLVVDPGWRGAGPFADLDFDDVLEELERRYGVGADRYEFAPVASCGLDAAGTITDINVAGAALLGAPMEGIVGRTLASFVSPPDRAAVLRHVRSCAARGLRTGTEARLLDLWGVETPVQITSSPFRDPRDGDLALVTVLVDISSWDRLREVSRGQRNDLTAILLNATTALRSEPEDCVGACEALARIRSIAERMRHRTLLGSPASAFTDSATEPPVTPAGRDAGLVVVIEGDDDSRSVIGEVLNFHGYAALLMTTVEEALTCVASIRVPPQAIVLDLDAPGRDGWQFLAERTRRAALRTIPVLAVSGGDSDDERRVLAAGAEYIPKPLQFDEIIAGLLRAIARRPSSRSDGPATAPAEWLNRDPAS